MSNPLEYTFTLKTAQKIKVETKIQRGPWLPRITRLMALAIKLTGQVSRGELKDYSDIARLGQISTARVSQIMSLTLLAPDIQEEILFLPVYSTGRDVYGEKKIMTIATEPLWSKQRKLWEKVKAVATVG